MIELYLIVIGLIIFGWLAVVLRQTQASAARPTPAGPVVPIPVAARPEAVLVAEGRGRVVYANETARAWFELEGGAPSLALLTRLVQPPDALHDLLAGAGHGAFRLGRRRVEGVTHTIPGEAGPRTVVVLRELDALAQSAPSDYNALAALTVAEDLSRITGSGLDLAAAADAILQAVGAAVPFTTAEITLWHEETRTLRVVGQGVRRTPSGALAPSAQPLAGVEYAVGEGYTGWIALYRQPLLIPDVAARADVQPKAQQVDFNSYLGVPLAAGDEFLGTLELSHAERDAFSPSQAALLQALATPIAAALQAAGRQQEQAARVVELAGLQQIAEASSQLSDPAQLFGQLTGRIAALLGVELCGVLLYDEDEGAFRSQIPFYGLPDSLMAKYRLALEPGSELHNIWQFQASWSTNDPASPLLRALLLEETVPAITLRQAALAPMLVSTRRIGLLVAANRHDARGFDDEDLRLLRSFAAQAAAAVENARLYAEKRRRAEELEGLQRIAQAIGAVRQPAELHAQVTAHVAALLGVQRCGVLLYDLAEAALIAQRPFFGLAEDALSVYRVPAPPGSAAARLWTEADSWLCNDLTQSDDGGELVARAVHLGMRQMATATLAVGANKLGILQVADRADGADFGERDRRLLATFAGQVAILLDNARLYAEMQRRAHEAEGLRAVSEIAASRAAPAETLERLLIAIANLLEAPIVALGVVDEATGDLVIEPDHLWGGSLAEPYRIPAYGPGFERSVLISRRPLLSRELRGDARVLPPYEGLIKRFRLRAWVQAPLIIGERSIGELTVAHAEGGRAFSEADVEFVQALAGHVAAVIERARLAQASDEDLRARVQTLSALGRVGQELRQTLDLDRVLDVIRQEALRSTAASAVSVALLSSPEDWDNAQNPRVTRRIGDEGLPPALTALEQAAARHNALLLVADYAAGDFEPQPPDARSAVVAPIAFGDQLIGLLHLSSPLPGAFDEEAVAFVVALTDHATVAIGSARRYQQQLAINERLRVRAERMGRIFELGELFRQGASLTALLEEVAHGVQETVDFNMVLISLVDESAGVLRRSAQAGMPLAVFEAMQQIAPPIEQAQGLLQPQYRISSSYFLPAEGAEALTADLPVYQPVAERSGPGPRAWDPEDLLLVPLYGARGRLLGLMSVDDPRSGRRPDQATVEALEVFANQAAFSIENYRLVERIRQEAEATRRERDRLAQLHLVATRIQSAPDVAARLQVVADGIREVGWGRVIITLRDAQLEPTATLHAGYSPEEAAALLPERVQSGAVWRRWINDLAFHEHKVGAAFYLRYDDSWVRQHARGTGALDASEAAPDAWHPHDALYLTLVSQDQKRIIGTISLSDPADGRAPTAASLQPFELFAAHATAAIETTRLTQEAQTRAAVLDAQAKRLETLNRVSVLLAETLDLDEIYRIVLYGLQDALAVQFAGLVVFEEADQGRLVLDTHPTFRRELAPAVPLRGNPSMEYILQTHRALLSVDVQTDPLLEPLWEVLRLRGTQSLLIVPLVVGDQVIGTIGLDSTRRREFTPDEIELAQTIGGQASVALEKARLYQEARDRAQALDEQAQRLALLNRVSLALAQTLDLENIFEIALREAAIAINVTEGAALLIDAANALTNVVVEYPRGDEPPQRVFDLRRSAVVARICADLIPLRVENRDEDPLAGELRGMLRAPDVSASLFVPLVVGGEVIGFLRLDALDHPASFTPAEVELAQTIASQAAVAVQNAGLFEQTAIRTRELEMLFDAAQETAVTLELDEVAWRVAGQMNAALNTDACAVFLWPGAGLPLEARADLHARPGVTPYAVGSLHTLADHPLRARALTARELIILRLDDDTLPSGERAALDARQAATRMLAPLVVNDVAIGLVEVEARDPNHYFRTETVRLARTLASQAAIAVENARLQTETRRAALVETTQSNAILDSVADAVLVADAEGRVVVCNSAVERVLGLPAERLLRQPAASLSGLYGAGQARWAEAVRAWREDPARYQPGEFLEERVTLDGGRVISVRLSPVQLGEQFLGTVSIFRDITREVEVDRLKSEFVATASHELRTPMTSIKGYVDLLLLGTAGAVSPAQQEFLATIKQNADRLSALVDDLLDISRLDQGRLELKPAPIHADELLEIAAAHIRGRARDEHSERQLVVEPVDAALCVWGDHEKLAQVVTNLADNAFSYTPAGGGITLGAAAEGEGVTLRVQDTGIGIPPEIAGRVFERFFRGDEAQDLVMNTPGTGLGLAIVRELVEAHGGRVWFESALGAGATFYAHLPAAEEEVSG